jgi:hypothetical protein
VVNDLLVRWGQFGEVAGGESADCDVATQLAGGAIPVHCSTLRSGPLAGLPTDLAAGLLHWEVHNQVRHDAHFLRRVSQALTDLKSPAPTYQPSPSDGCACLTCDLQLEQYYAAPGRALGLHTLDERR